jgi:di/tricarboxylate transporter
VKLLARPLLYAIWAVLVVGALAATAVGDPYIFGFTCLIAGVASGAVAIVAVAVTVLAKQLAWPARAVILGSMLVTGAALAAAFAYLGTFKWA